MPRETYIQERLEKGRQKAKLLASRPDFQQDIATLRATWDIPQKGIKNPDQAQRWYRDLLRKDVDYKQKHWPKTRKTILALKKKDTVEDLRKAEQLQKEFNKRTPLNNFKNDINNLVTKYNQSPQMRDAIESYLKCNVLEFLAGQIGVTIHESITEDDQVTLSLIITEHTTLRDIKAVWPTIKMHQEMLPYYKRAKQQPIPNFDRDQKIFELYQGGKSSTEITQIVNKSFRPTITYAEISKIVQRHKKHLGIN